MVFENFHEVFLENNVGKTDDNIITDTANTLDADYSKTVHFNMISKDVTAPNANNAFVVNMDPVTISLEQFQEAFYSCFDNYSYDYDNTDQDIYKLRKQKVCGKNIPFLKIVLEFYKHQLGCDQLSPETEIKITNELANINDIRYICKKNSHTLTWKSLFNALLEQNDDGMGQEAFLKKNHLFKLIFRVHNNDPTIRDIHFVFNFVVIFDDATGGLNAGTKKYETSIQSIVQEGGYTW